MLRELASADVRDSCERWGPPPCKLNLASNDAVSRGPTPECGGRLLAWSLIGGLLLSPAAGAAQTQPRPWDPVTEERLLEPADGDWMSYRRSYDVTGFSPLDQVDRDNVGELQLVWSFSMQ